MTGDGADWPAIAGDVAVALLGEPSSRSGRELRYGRKGSLSVHLDKGTWRDHESATGGGVLDLVKRERGCDTAGAMAWLKSVGFVESRDRERRPERPVGGDSIPEPAETGPDPRAAFVRLLWARAVPADSTPGRHYLARRLAWPPAGIGPELPATVRWLAREAAPGHDPAAKWYGLPDGAAGALVFAWRRPGDADPDPRAVTVIAVSAQGERLPAWPNGPKVREAGTRAGTVFEARAPSSGADAAHVAEGEADALALALAPWCGPGGVYAAGGTPGLRTDPERFTALTSGPVVLHADDGEGGGGAVAKAQARIQATGRECRVEWYAGDPADALAEWIVERAAIREFDGGEARDDADRGAWHDLLSEVSIDGR